MKVCKNPSCTQVNPQPLDQFKPKARYKDGLYSRCKTCDKADDAAYNAAYAINNADKLSEKYKRDYWRNPEKHRKKARLGRFKQKYWPDLTLKEIDIIWNKMFAEQNGLCSICEKPKPLEVEHCHKTGKVRSLACNGCNTALARIYENAIIASKLITYITKHCE